MPVASTVSAGSQFFIVLIAGLIFALAIHGLLLWVSAATGMSSFKIGAQSLGGTVAGPKLNKKRLGERLFQVSTAAGIWTLLSVTFSIFLACFFAVKLGLVDNRATGSLLGLVVWATYFTGLVWFATRKIGKAVGSALGTAVEGVQMIFSSAGSVLAGRARNRLESRRMKKNAAIVRKEILGNVNRKELKCSLQKILAAVKRPEVELDQVRREMQVLLDSSQFRELVSNSKFNNDAKQAFYEMLRSRGRLSDKNATHVAQEFEDYWRAHQQDDTRHAFKALQQFLRKADLKEFLRAEPSTLDKLVDAFNTASHTHKKMENSEAYQVATAVLLALLKNTISHRKDFEQSVLGRIYQKLEPLRNRLFHEEETDAAENSSLSQEHSRTQSQGYPSQQAATPLFDSIVRNDVENWLLTVSRWTLRNEQLDAEFSHVIVDHEASPARLARELYSFDREFVVSALRLRADLTEEEVNQIANKLETYRVRELERVVHLSLDSPAQTESEPRRAALRAPRTARNFIDHLADYLRLTGKMELISDESREFDLRMLLTHPALGDASIDERIQELEPENMKAWLLERSDFTPQEAEALAETLIKESANYAPGTSSPSAWTQRKMQELTDAISNRIRASFDGLKRPELAFDAIAEDVRKIFQAPGSSFHVVKSRVSQFDRNTITALLAATRKDFTEQEASALIGKIETLRDNALQSAEQFQKRTKKKLSDAKDTTLLQLDDSRRAAAAAAWWLVATGVLSAIAAAVGGSLAAL